MKKLFAMCLAGLCCAASILGQTDAAAPVAVVPPVVRYTGTLPASAASVTAGVTFALYKDQSGGAPLWLETQSVTLDGNGRYSVNLGSNHAGGIPAELFAGGEARWLGVQPEGQPERPRVLLVSVPYAMKAADADTLGGLPASSYVTAEQLQNQSLAASRQSPAPAPESDRAPDSDVTPSPCSAVASDGTALANYLTKFTAPCNVENSGIYQSALATTPGFLGIGTTAPVAPLDMEPAAQTGTSGGLFGVHVITNFNPTGNSTGNYYGIYGQSNSSTGNTTNFTGDIVGSGFIAQHYGTGTVSNLFGANYSVQNRAGGTVTNAVGFYGGVSNLGAGTITNGYGLQVPVPQNSGGGVFTNFYGVYIANPTGITNSWGLYSLANTNYMSGKLGINVTAPTQALEINGNLKLDTAGHGITYPDGSVQTTATIPGSGTITKVTAGTDLTGGGSSGAVTLSLDTTKVPTLSATSNTFTGSITASSFTGNGLSVTNVNAAALGGVAASGYAQLAAQNNFSAWQRVNGPAVTSGSGSVSISAYGSNTSDPGAMDGGWGVYAVGGTPTANAAAPGGVGVEALGGAVGLAGQTAGTGVVANGGSTSAGGNGGRGMVSTGSSGSGGDYLGGDGIDAYAGAGSGSAGGGLGGQFTGGNGTAAGAGGGFGIQVFPGTDMNGNSAPAGFFGGQIWIQNPVAPLLTPQLYLEQTTTTDYSRVQFFVDTAAASWTIAVGGGAHPVMNLYRSDIGNVMSLTPGGSQYMLMANGALLTTGGVWTNNSDRNLKEEFTAVNGADLLARLQAVPMSSWKYKTETGVRHLGPMAQDFYAAFGLGDDNKHISTVDEGGVALAAIQELYRQGLQKDAEIRQQREQIKVLSRQVAELSQAQSSLAELESRLTKLEGEQQAAPASLPKLGADKPAAPTLVKAQLRSE